MTEINYGMSIFCFGDSYVNHLIEWLNTPIIRGFLLPGIVPLSETNQTRITEDTLAQLHAIIEQQRDRETGESWFPLIAERNTSLRLTTRMTYPTAKYPGLYPTLEFTSAHLEANLLDYAALKQLILETAQVLPANYIHVDDRTLSHTPSRDTYKLYAGPYGRLYWARLGWMYFFGNDLVEFIGVGRFENLETCHEKQRLPEGYFIALTELPFDLSNQEHQAREEKALHELGMDELVKMYPAQRPKR